MNSELWTWIKSALIRCVKTMAQTCIAVIGTSYLISDINWWIVLSASVVAGILSILTSIAGIPETDEKGLPEIVKDTNDDESEPEEDEPDMNESEEEGDE